jgi:hypothetical protein
MNNNEAILKENTALKQKTKNKELEEKLQKNIQIVKVIKDIMKKTNKM